MMYITAAPITNPTTIHPHANEKGPKPGVMYSGAWPEHTKAVCKVASLQSPGNEARNAKAACDDACVNCHAALRCCAQSKAAKLVQIAAIQSGLDNSAIQHSDA